MKTIVIIGGGITGLSTAYHLQEQVKANKLSANILLIEANDTLGGKINTVHDGEFIMESGADSIVARKPNMAPLIEKLGLEDEVVYNATGKSFIHAEGQLKPIPDDTIFGIPLSIESLAQSTLISAEGKVDALKDFYTKNESFTKNDSIGPFLSAFLGDEIVQKQISPVLSGVYSGNINDLTLASTLPYLLDYKNEYGSIIQGLFENRKTFQGTGDKKFLSFKNGLSTLVDGFEQRLTEVEVIKGVKANSLVKADERYIITLANGQTIETDFVVLSTVHSAAQSLLQTEELDEDFDQLLNSSMISIYVCFDIPDHMLPKDGTGFIVTDSSDLVCNACTWTSRKWEHTSKNNRLLVRLFYKSSVSSYETLQKLSEADLLKVALKDIEDSLGLNAQPLSHVVTKWNDAMPNYHIKHPAIVQSLETKMEKSFPDVILAGCSYYGVGIPDCIANGEKIAQQIINRVIVESSNMDK